MLWKQSWPIVSGNKTGVGVLLLVGAFVLPTICRRLEGKIQYPLKLCFDTKLIGQIWEGLHFSVYYFCMCSCLCMCICTYLYVYCVFVREVRDSV